MKKYHIILIVLLSIFFMPNTAMACGNSNSKHTCEKEVSSMKTEKKSCCNNDSKSKEDKGCNGDCGHSKCGCSSTCPSSSISFLPEIIFKINFIRYSSIEKVEFSYTTPSISDGFRSIWLIPKIG